MRKTLGTLLALAILALALAGFPVAQGQEIPLSVHFIGIREAILLDWGDQEMLIDGDHDNTTVADYIAPYVDGDLEVVLATHQDMDHVGGLTYVLDRYQVDQIYWNGDDFSVYKAINYTRVAFLTAARAEPNSTFTVVQRGDTIAFGPITMQVLNPPRPYLALGTSYSSNANSIVLRFTWGTTSFLLTGDAEKKYANPNMLAAGLNLQGDIYKLGHHGLGDSTSTAFARAVAPKVAINVPLYPSSNVLVALGQFDSPPVPIYYTRLHGAVIVTAYENGYGIWTQTGAAPVYSPY